MSPHYNFSRPFPHDVGAHQRCRLCIHPGQPLRPCAACLRVLARFVPLLASRPHLLHHLTACSSGSPSSAPTHCGEESVGVRPLQTNASASRYSRSELRLRPRLRLRLHLRLWHARPHRSLRPQPHLRLTCSPGCSPCSTQSAPLLGAGALAPTPPAPAPRLLQPRLRLTRPRRSLLTLRPRLLRRPPPCLATLPRGRWPPCSRTSPRRATPTLAVPLRPCRCARAPRAYACLRVSCLSAAPAPPLQEPQPHHPKIAIWDPPKSTSHFPTS